MALCLLPLVILLWDPLDEPRRIREDLVEEWLTRTQFIVKDIQRLGNLRSWVGDLNGKLNRFLSRSVRPGIRPREFAALLSEGKRRLSAPEYRGWRIYGVAFPDGDTSKMPEFCQGPGLGNGSRFLPASFFRDLGQGYYSSPKHGPTQRNWLPSLRNLFGPVLFLDSFLPENRGKPVFVIHQRRYWALTWDFVQLEGRPVGGYISLFPVSTEPSQLALKWILKKWRPPFDIPGCQIVFIRFPGKPGERASLLCRTPVASSPAFPFIRGLADTVRVEPGHLVNSREYERFLVLVALGESLSGFPWLRGHLNGFTISWKRFFRLNLSSTRDWLGRTTLENLYPDRFIEMGKFWGRIIPLSGSTRSFGLLVFPRPKQAPPFRERVGKTWASLLVLGLLGILAVRIRFGEIPLPGIRVSLTSWFLGMIALPGVLVLGASAGFLSDLNSNLDEKARLSIARQLYKVDSQAAALLQEQSRKVTVLLKDPQIAQSIWDIQWDGKSPEAFMQGIRDRLRAESIPLLALTVTGIRQFYFDWFSDSVSSETKDDLSRFFFEFSTALTQSRKDWEDSWDPKPGQRTYSRPPTFNFELIRASLLNQSWTCHRFRVAGKDRVTFHGALPFKGRFPFAVFLMWELGDLLKNQLTEVISRAMVQERIELTAFDEQPDGSLEALPKNVRSPPGVADVAKLARRGLVSLKFGGYIYSVFQSNNIPGIVLVGRIPQEPILREILDAQFKVAGIAFGTISLVFLVGFGLSRWLGEPMVNMTRVLERISEGDLGNFLPEGRTDEVGKVMNGLNEMIRSLQERRSISTFVSPQVLDILQDENRESAMKPAVRSVAFLVSDIRGFTGLSESQPPQTVFSLLNRHLEGMSKAIQANGGVIDRFIGDAIQAVFYPMGEEPPVLRAVRAGIHMMKVHRSGRAGNLSDFAVDFQIGVGITQGEVVTGIVGDPQVRLDLTVLGDIVQRAETLESSSRNGRFSRIVVGSELKDLVGSRWPLVPVEQSPGTWEIALDPSEAPS